MEYLECANNPAARAAAQDYGKSQGHTKLGLKLHVQTASAGEQIPNYETLVCQASCSSASVCLLGSQVESQEFA